MVKRGILYETLKDKGKIEEFDDNQPVIAGKKSKIYTDVLYFLPQYCYPAYHPYLVKNYELAGINNIKKNSKL
ncbi:hypothetical protein ACO3UB_00415 [Methanocaldococcus sp. 16A]